MCCVDEMSVCHHIHLVYVASGACQVWWRCNTTAIVSSAGWSVCRLDNCARCIWTVRWTRLSLNATDGRTHIGSSHWRRPLISSSRCWPARRRSLLADVADLRLVLASSSVHGRWAEPASHASLLASLNARMYRAFLAVVSTRWQLFHHDAFLADATFPTRLLMNFDAKRPGFISRWSLLFRRTAVSVFSISQTIYNSPSLYYFSWAFSFTGQLS